MKPRVRGFVHLAMVVAVVGGVGWQLWQPRRLRGSVAAANSARGVRPHASLQTVDPQAKVDHRRSPAAIRLGTLVLDPCQLRRPDSAVTTAAFCARFQVPEDRADPHSRTIELKLAIIKSRSQVPDKDLVVYLAGGPGQSAIRSYPELAPAFAPLLRHHDVLLLDQRGTGASHPLACPGVAQGLKQTATVGSSPAQLAGWVAKCARVVERAADPRYYTTSDAVADLEAVRRALGSPRLDLVGVSYGTRVAQHYASAYPGAVRSIVLDGVVPNQLVLGETFAQTLQRSLKLQAAACADTPACKGAFGDWYQTLHRLYTELEHEPPRRITFRDPYTYQSVTGTLSANTLAGVVRLFSYSAVTAALLPLAVSQAARGNYAPLLGQSRLVKGDLSASIDDGVQLSVLCTEDAPLLKPRPGDAGTLLGDRFIEDLVAECRAWPHNPMPRNFHAPFKSSIPTLLISGGRDPVTPPSFAAEVLRGLADGRSLVVKGLGHAEAIDAGCMPKLVEHFIDELQPRRLDAGCLRRIGPPPAFVDFNGAAP